jgi:hypothetical protein
LICQKEEVPLLRKLNNYSHKNKLYQSFRELGRVIRTIFFWNILRIKYNNLVANAVILQNVVDMTYILKELSANGVEVTKSDVAALSPYITRHIKRFGDYVIDLENIPKAIDMNISIPMKQEKAT